MSKKSVADAQLDEALQFLSFDIHTLANLCQGDPDHSFPPVPRGPTRQKLRVPFAMSEPRP